MTAASRIEHEDAFGTSEVQTSLDALRALVQLKPDASPITTNTRELITSLAALGCTANELASVLRYDVNLLKTEFAAELARGEALGHLSLRRAQFRVALAGNPAMLKHLGEVVLGQVPGLRLGALNQDPEDAIDPRETLKAKLDSMYARITPGASPLPSDGAP
jgi:hypothetical protein